MEVSSRACARFGLDPSKLENEELLKNRCYRRLYNIVATDQTHTSSVFRPNLIKELYFLLQITPFIQDVLQDHFLSNIQQWYNSNDHKKIQLSKNLQKKVDTIFKPTKQKQSQCKRPKTGVSWDSSLNPFLRPYTAKMGKNIKGNSFYQIKNQKQGIQSTNANTYERDISDQGNKNIKNVIDIEQQWERSQDFTNKYRTLHPQQEPTYQKLLNIIERASQMGSQNNSYHFSKENKKEKRKIQSAMVNRQKSKQAAEEELMLMRNNQQMDEEQEDFNEFEQKQEDNQEDTNPAIQMEEVQFDGVKCFTKDKRTKTGNIQARMYTRVNGMRIVRPLTGKQANIIEKLGTYSNLTKNSLVCKTKEDQQFANHYQEYIRKRTNLKRELSRKTQSIRMLKSAKQQRRTPSSGQLLTKKASQNKENQMPNVNTKIQGKNEVKEFVLSGPIEKENKLSPKQLVTHYDQNNFFRNSSSSKIKSALRDLKQQRVGNFKEDNEKNNPTMTINQRFGSQFKFDPLNTLSRDTYNQEILEDIEKIKTRFGGQFSASTDALMKALYIETPIQQMEFQVPNKRYVMFSNGQKKKKKKKGRKLNKNKSLKK